MSDPVQDALVRLREQLGQEPQACLAKGCTNEAVRGPGDTFHAGTSRPMFCHEHWWDLSQKTRDEIESKWEDIRRK